MKSSGRGLILALFLAKIEMKIISANYTHRHSVVTHAQPAFAVRVEGELLMWSKKTKSGLARAPPHFTHRGWRLV